MYDLNGVTLFMNFHNDYCPSSLEMISTGAQNSSTDCSSGLEYQGIVLGYWTTGNHDEIIAVPTKLTSVWTASILNIVLLLLSLKYSFSSVAIVIPWQYHSIHYKLSDLYYVVFTVTIIQRVSLLPVMACLC